MTKRLKVDGLWPKWTVQNTQSGQSTELDGPEIKKMDDPKEK